RALEQVLEGLVNRGREDQRADHEGDADHDREAGQERPQLSRQQAPQCQLCHATAFIRSRTPVASVPAPSWTTTPSLRITIRSATAADCGSWVTMITVCSNSLTAWRRRLRTSSDACVSRLPVGSSANTT